MKKNIVLFPHGGSGNHGCEAIVRTTALLLNEYDVHLYSEKPEEDKLYSVEKKIAISSSHVNTERFSVKYLKAFFSTHFMGQHDAYDVLYYDPVVSACNRDTVLLSIGGDNYCYGDNELVYSVNRAVRARGCKTVLWGCSVEKEIISDKMKLDLAAYNLIIARESITYHTLRAINPNTILIPDPAFSLAREKGKKPEGLGDKPYVGINISPMIQSHERKEGITYENYETLIRNILDITDQDVALIPHVVWSNNDDRKPLTRLYDQFSASGRVYLVEDQNCMQLKDIIAGCTVFVGARTHATIAAYSSCVPTLVVGYSVKARGIATDLFGTDQHYVVPVQSLELRNDLWKSFSWIYDRQATIAAYLSSLIPDYRIEVKKMNENIKKIIY